MSSSQDIDSMLDAALDELGDDSDEEDFHSKQSPANKIMPEQPPVVQSSSPAVKVPPARPVMGPPRPPTGPAAAKSSTQKQQSPSSSATKTSDQIAEEMLSGWMQQMINAEEDPQARMDMLHAMNKATAPSTSPSKSSSSQPEGISTSSSHRNEKRTKTAQHEQATEEVDNAISQLMEGMALATDDNDNDRVASSNHTEEEALLRQLLQGLQGAMDSDGAHDDNSNPDALVDGMMEQLMSKDLMYEPMKQVSLEFPGWLETHKQDLSQEEFVQRQKQHQCFEQIVHIYDTEPSNTRKLVELMQEVQEFGQPPPEIIQKIAPGLELDGEGVPQMDFFSALNEDDCKIS